MSHSGQEPAELFRLIHALRRYAEVADRTVDAAGHRSGLHRTDLRALTILMQRQAAGLTTSPTDLGRMLRLTSASTTALVDRLVSNGHAERTPSTTDRRRVSISHTDTAAVDGQRIFRPMARTMADRLSGFTPGQMQSAIDVLAAASEALDDLAAAADAPPSDVTP